MSDFDEGLDFDDMRNCREDHQPFVEIPLGIAGSGGGCVVEMVSARYGDPRVMSIFCVGLWKLVGHYPAPMSGLDSMEEVFFLSRSLWSWNWYGEVPAFKYYQTI